MSRGSSTRSLYFPDGNPEAKLPPFCVLGNTLLCRCIVLIRLVTFNGCQWLLEQPGSSLVPKCVRMTRLAADTSVATPISICGHGLVCSCIVVLGFTSAKHDSSDVHLRRCCHYPYPFFLIRQVWIIRFAQGAHGAATTKATMVLSNSSNIEA